jgi:hypothetical protein
MIEARSGDFGLSPGREPRVRQYFKNSSPVGTVPDGDTRVRRVGHKENHGRRIHQNSGSRS